MTFQLILRSHDDYLDPAPLSLEALPYCYKFSELQTTQSSPVDVIKKILNNDVLVGKPEPALIAPFFLQQNEFGNSVHQALERVRNYKGNFLVGGVASCLWVWWIVVCGCGG